MEQQQKQQTEPADGDDDDPSQLAGEVESRLREYLARATEEFPAGCQADWLAGVVAERVLRADDAETATMPVYLVKLCVYLMESLAEVSGSYEEYYSKQVDALRDESASAHAQVAALEDENGRLREQLHRRAEELRNSQAAVDALKARNLAAAGSAGLRFDEAVDVVELGDDDDEDNDDDDKAEAEEVGNGDCGRCRRYRELADRAVEDAATRLAEAAVKNAALKADLADWEADMAEKVHQNVELAAQLEASQRALARLGRGSGSGVNTTNAAAAGASRGIFGRVTPLLRKK